MLLTLNNLTKQIILSLLVISLILPSTALAFVTTTGMPFAASNLIPGATVAGSIISKTLLERRKDRFADI